MDEAAVSVLRHETAEQLARRLTSGEGRRVWAYVRVSSQKQADNESIPAQIQAITEWAAKHSLETPHFVVEVASAAKPLFLVNLPGTPKEKIATETAPRPKLLLLLGFLRELQGAHLIFWKLDRLARIDYEQELFLDLLRRAKVTVHSVQAGEAHMLDGGAVSDPARVFSRQILASAAQYERAMLEMRMRTGLTYKAARGGYTGGPPPYGYTMEKRELKVDAAEAKIVRYIFCLAKLHGMNQLSITDHLNAHRMAGTPAFNRQKIARILKAEPLYRGVYKDCFDTTHARPDLRILPDDEEELSDEFSAK